MNLHFPLIIKQELKRKKKKICKDLVGMALILYFVVKNQNDNLNLMRKNLNMYLKNTVRNVEYFQEKRELLNT